MDSQTQMMIENHIANHGVSKCPTAFAAPTTADGSEADAKAHRRRGLDPVGDNWRKKNGHKFGWSAYWSKKRGDTNLTGVRPPRDVSQQLRGVKMCPAQHAALEAVMNHGSASSEAIASRIWATRGLKRPKTWKNSVKNHVMGARRAIEPLGWTVRSQDGVFYLLKIEGDEA